MTVPGQPAVDLRRAAQRCWARDQPAAVRAVVDGHAERAQRGRHQRGVAAAQRRVHGGRSVGQCGEHQRAVGDRLGTGNGYRRADGAGGVGSGPLLSHGVDDPASAGHAARTGLATCDDDALGGDRLCAVGTPPPRTRRRWPPSSTRWTGPRATRQDADYNIAPTKQRARGGANATPLTRRRPTDTSERSIRVMRWGLVPHWAKDLSGAAKMINARSESVLEKPAYKRFRDASAAASCRPTAGTSGSQARDASSRTSSPAATARASRWRASGPCGGQDDGSRPSPAPC